MLKVGDKAPEFVLQDQNDNSVSLTDYKGQTIVLWFFPKANTPGWIIEGKGFRDEFQNFIKQKIQIIGCSADQIKKQKNMNFDIEVDGGINFDNSKLVKEAGANILVSGTTVFKDNEGDIKKNIEILKTN